MLVMDLMTALSPWLCQSSPVSEYHFTASSVFIPDFKICLDMHGCSWLTAYLKTLNLMISSKFSYSTE